MALIILSTENWNAAKASLHAALPHVRSSHLAEAIAAGLGALQHAALLSRLRKAADCPDIAAGSDERFVERLGQLGYPAIQSGHFDAAFAHDATPHGVYTSFKRGDRLANSRHYDLCSRLGRPMMMVKMARVYAELEWDSITVGSRQEGYLHHSAGEQLVGMMFRLFQARAKGAPGTPIFVGSAFTGTVKNLLPHTARQLAEDYFKLLYLPLLEGAEQAAADPHSSARSNVQDAQRPRVLLGART